MSVNFTMHNLRLNGIFEVLLVFFLHLFWKRNSVQILTGRMPFLSPSQTAVKH